MITLLVDVAVSGLVLGLMILGMGLLALRLGAAAPRAQRTREQPSVRPATDRSFSYPARASKAA